MKILFDEQVKEVAAIVTAEYGLDFVHAQISGSLKSLVISIFIDKPGGVTHEDCAKTSRKIETLLDAMDSIPSSYLLEVSSPGLERELYSQKDFEKFVGSLAKIKVNSAVNGQKNFRGRITDFKDGEIVFDDRTSGVVRFPYSTVVKANLEIDLDNELKNINKR